jgi:cytidylate kinase
MTLSVAQLASRQIRLWELLKGARQSAPMASKARPSITISREAGVGVSRLAERLGGPLHFSIWDHQIIEFVANTVGVRRQLIQSLEEHQQSAVERWIEGALRGHLVDASDYARALVQVLRVLGEQGGVIVIGRGGNFVLSPETTVRVRVIAPLAWRSEHARRPGETEEEVRRRLIDQDNQRIRFVKQTLKSDPCDPSAYDVTLNAGQLTLDCQHRIVLEALHSRF